MAGCNDTRTLQYHGADLFQSAPGTMAGCNRCRFIFNKSKQCFNPHPALWPGVTNTKEIANSGLRMFQSAPGTMAGCNLLILITASDYILCFNPHPALWPGVTCRSAKRSLYFALRFNPHPTLWPGVTGRRGRRRRGASGFNPHPALWPGVTTYRYTNSGIVRVSIRTRHYGRV